jgi:hypothetical protein
VGASRTGATASTEKKTIKVVVAILLFFILLMLGIAVTVGGLMSIKNAEKVPGTTGEASQLNSSSSNFSYPSNVDPASLTQCLNDALQELQADSPLNGRGNRFAVAGVEPNINPALSIAMGMAETTLGTAGHGARDNHHNPFGLTTNPSRADEDLAEYTNAGDRYYTINGGDGITRHFIKFKSWEAAIDYHPAYIQRRYISQGYTTLPRIYSLYVRGSERLVPGAENSDWVRNVTATYNKVLRHCPQLFSPAGTTSAQKIVSTARDAHARFSANESEFVEEQNWHNRAWCAEFATWVYRQAGADVPLIGPAISVADTFAADPTKYVWISANKLETPSIKADLIKPGDIFVMKAKRRNQQGWGYHAGIIEDVDSDNIYTIEGNTHDDGSRGQLGKNTRRLSETDFVGVGRMR